MNKEYPINSVKELSSIREEVLNTPENELTYSIPKEDVASITKAITELYESRYINPVSSIAFRLANNYIKDNEVEYPYDEKREMIDNILKDITKYMMANNINVVEWENTDEGKKFYKDNKKDKNVDTIVSNIKNIFDLLKK